MFGTILVDLDAGRVLDVLPDRSSQSVANWLGRHPEVEIVSRDRHGLYAGAAIKGGSIWPDTDANLAYYGLPLSAKEILFDRKVKPTAAGEELAQRITESSK